MLSGNNLGVERGTIDTKKEFGHQTVWFRNRPLIVGGYSIAGEKEGAGPIGKFIDKIVDEFFDEKTHEQAEQKMFEFAIRGAIKDAGLDLPLNKAGKSTPMLAPFKGGVASGRAVSDTGSSGTLGVDMILAGDLLNQIISSSFAARSFDAMFLGVYGACSTMALSLALGGLLVDGGYAGTVAVAAGSHFATAERQYRTPLELGNQRPPNSQWTVTGVGSTVITGRKPKADKYGAHVVGATFGKVIDWGVRDVNNMGAAMAPAAAATLIAPFRDIKLKKYYSGGTKDNPDASPLPGGVARGERKPDEDLCKTLEEYNKAFPYDAVFTGDLGKLGEEILRTLLADAGYPLDARYSDCGRLIFSEKQNLYQGGSGCGCSAVTLNGFILDKFRRKEYNKILFMATGALLSPVSSYQGNTVPGIAHAVIIER